MKIVGVFLLAAGVGVVSAVVAYHDPILGICTAIPLGILAARFAP